ncbi:baculoviral IAP repeat-containing protein 5-like [Peromyscus eremicus]|uniref:baculoviral IAP repeat-containing protein 5-like n=1 Tax=Peromyscus eremicus TaxID=42410 RepID=UPI0027DE703C|nr:baculoviral IAP repeat-containing protein 5-like [Peromyscus eremicus]
MSGEKAEHEAYIMRQEAEKEQGLYSPFHETSIRINSALESQTWQLYLMDHPISTFKNWPFLEGCSCVPKRMAKAGFIHCPTENKPDLAQCFFCCKELKDWEPDDNIIEEHKKHSPGCAFLTVKNQFEELTLTEYWKLNKERAKNKIAKETNSKQKEFEETSKTFRHSIEQPASFAGVT